MVGFPLTRTAPVVFVLSAVLLCAELLSPAAAQAEVPEEFVANDEEAVVIFVRPCLSKATQKKSFKTNPLIMWTDDKIARGVLVCQEYSVISVEPGKQSFYVWQHVAMAKMVVLYAELTAGRTYVVRTELSRGGNKAETVRRGSPNFAWSVGWLRDTKPSTVVSMEVKQADAESEALFTKKVQKAEERQAVHSQEKRDQLTLQPEDGRTAEEVRSLKLD